MPDEEDRGRSAVIVAMEDAARAMRRRRRPPDPPPQYPRGPNKDIYPNVKNAPPNWTPNALGLPTEEPCPVIPLGKEGELYHMLDSGGTFRTWQKQDFNHVGIQSLFGLTPNYPAWAWPRYGRVPKVKEGEAPKPAPIESFDDDGVRDALFGAFEVLGQFAAGERLRGRGGWLLDGGQFSYHAGEDVWIWEPGTDRPRALPTGMMGDYLYQRLPSIPGPWTEPLYNTDEVVTDLYRMLASPNWRRGKVDALLLLGWIGVGYFGGALDWRSAVLLLGDVSTGKSTLQRELKMIFKAALFDSGDTTKAGIFQALEHDTRPVAVDELEPDAQGSKVQQVVDLMRVAASGEVTRRGSAGGRSQSYQVRSGFLFSAINNPLSFAQDFSRVAVLRLNSLPANPPPRPTINPDVCGRIVLARLMRAWPKFYQLRQVYMAALAGGGHNNRGQLTYGTLLAAAESILGVDLMAELDLPIAEDAQFWREHLAADALPEVESAKPNWRGCLEWLLTNVVEAWRQGTRKTVGALLADVGYGEDDLRPEAARRLLADAGLGLLTAHELVRQVVESFSEEEAAGILAVLQLHEGDGLILAIPNSHPQVGKMFDKSQWQGQAGGTGPWLDALRQCPVPGVVISDRRVNRVRIGGVQTRCTLIVMAKYQTAAER